MIPTSRSSTELAMILELVHFDSVLLNVMNQGTSFSITGRKSQLRDARASCEGCSCEGRKLLSVTCPFWNSALERWAWQVPEHWKLSVARISDLLRGFMKQRMKSIRVSFTNFVVFDWKTSASNFCHGECGNATWGHIWTELIWTAKATTTKSPHTLFFLSLSQAKSNIFIQTLGTSA
jgi:hypothetical protein